MGFSIASLILAKREEVPEKSKQLEFLQAAKFGFDTKRILSDACFSFSALPRCQLVSIIQGLFEFPPACLLPFLACLPICLPIVARATTLH
jgi:hypothetical protein